MNLIGLRVTNANPYIPEIEEKSENAVPAFEQYTFLFNSFFGFRESPFNNTPDSQFFYMGRRHREILMNMIFGIQMRRGFIVVTGEIGAGKSTLCRQFLQDIPAEIKTAVVLNPNMSGTHLLGHIVKDFGIQCKGNTKQEYFEALNAFLLEGIAHQQNACLVIDEAQCLGVRLLEEIRLLTNLETGKQKLLQIILMGQPELRDILAKPELTQLRQRIGVFCQLQGMSLDEMKDYALHRLHHASESLCQLSFEEAIWPRIHQISRGIPRLINSLCDRILMAAFAQQTKEISMELAAPAFEEMAFICQK